MHIAVRPHNGREQVLHHREMPVQLLRNRHERHARDGRAKEHAPTPGAGERTLPPHERDDRRVERDRGQLKDGITILVKGMPQRRRLHHGPRHEQCEHAAREDRRREQVRLLRRTVKHRKMPFLIVHKSQMITIVATAINANCGYSSKVPLYATRRTFWMDVRARGSFETTIFRTRL